MIIESRTYNYNQTLGGLPTPSRFGFDFVGWYSNREGTGEQASSETHVVGDMTYYAKWVSSEKVTITWNSNGGNEVQSIQLIKGTAIGELPVSEKDGYNFAGWYSDQEFSYPVSESTIFNADATLYAKWGGATYNIYWNLERIPEDLIDSIFDESVEFKDSYVVGSAYTPPTGNTVTGYTFGGWDPVKIDASTIGDVTFIALGLNPNEYTITFNVGEGTFVSSEEEGTRYVSHGEQIGMLPEVNPPSGKNFSGWFNGDSLIDSEYVVEEDLVLEARYVNDGTATITFYSNPDNGVGEEGEDPQPDNPSEEPSGGDEQSTEENAEQPEIETLP